jgi:predicted dehydrogenase
LTLDIAVIGCGAVIERLYRGALRKLESRGIARVAALVDPNPARTAAIRRHFPSAAEFASPSAAFARNRPDLTIVASPPALHAEHSIAALDAGSHVLCEKPMAISVEDAERMAAAARVAGRVLAIGMVRRMYPSLAAARTLLSAGELGEGLRFEYREGDIYGWPITSNAAFRRTTGGGGVLADLGSHVVDFLAALFGSPTATAYSDDAATEGVETNCRIDLVHPGAGGRVQLSWNQPLASGLRVAGTSGELILDPGIFDSVRWRPKGGAWRTQIGTATLPVDLRRIPSRGTPRSRYDSAYYQLVQVLRAVVYGEPVPVAADQGLATVRVIDACYRQATPLTHPWLTATEQAEMRGRHWSHERWAAA